MNLIEEFGGYERAKEIAFDPLHPQMTHVSNDGRHWVNEEFSHLPEIQHQIQSMIRIEDIRTAIAAYEKETVLQNADGCEHHPLKCCECLLKEIDDEYLNHTPFDEEKHLKNADEAKFYTAYLEATRYAP